MVHVQWGWDPPLEASLLGYLEVLISWISIHIAIMASMPSQYSIFSHLEEGGRVYEQCFSFWTVYMNMHHKNQVKQIV